MHHPRFTSSVPCSPARGWLLTLTGDSEESEHEFSCSGEEKFVSEQIKKNGSILRQIP